MDNTSEVGEVVARRDYSVFHADFVNVILMFAFQIFISCLPYAAWRGMEDPFSER